MYFLPKYNLLENVENAEEMKKISDKIAELSKDIPAIITAIKSVANTKLGNVIVTDMFRLLARTTRVEEAMFENEFAKNGCEIPEFEVPKEVTFIGNIFDNVFENIFF